MLHNDWNSISVYFGKKYYNGKVADNRYIQYHKKVSFHNLYSLFVDQGRKVEKV